MRFYDIKVMREKYSPEFEEKELIEQLSELKGIRPREEWVLLTKTQLFSRHAESLPSGAFGQSPSLAHRILEAISILGAKPAFVLPVLAILVLGGIVGQLAQKSLPGDRLYALRATTERLQYSVTPESRAFVHLELAQSRLEDLRKIAQTNRVKNLDPAIKEFEQSVAEASRGLQLLQEEPKKALEATEQIAQLEKKRVEVEQILGAAIGQEESEDLENATRNLVEYEIADLELRQLTEEQQELLNAAKAALEERNYQEALEYLFDIGQK